MSTVFHKMIHHEKKLVIQGQAANRDEETFAGNLYPNVYS